MKEYNELFEKYVDNYSPGDEQKEKIELLDENSSIEVVKPLINEIVLWKLNRMVEVDDELIKSLLKIRRITDIEFFLNSNDLRDELKDTMKKLMDSKGIRIAMASTILHFFNPKIFPIIDKRAYFAINNCLMPERINNKNNGPDEYLLYIEKCYKWFLLKSKNEKDLKFENIDKVLYQHDKDSGRKLDRRDGFDSVEYDIWKF